MKRTLLILWMIPVTLWSQDRYAIIIDEILADPSPSVGLPPYEWVELKNRSDMPINLAGWTMGDRTGTSGPLPPYLLPPDSFVLVCSSGGFASLSAIGPTLSITGFPSLDNDGDELFIANADGQTIHAVRYEVSWYQNHLKESGGWSLEMIDTQNPCGGLGNWTASLDPRGGTPGRKNSVDSFYPDQIGPVILNGYTANDSTLVLLADEPLDSGYASNPDHYHFTPDLPVYTAELIGPVFDRIQLITRPLDPHTIYTLQALSITDCHGNQAGKPSHLRIGIPSTSEERDLVINEILFNPVSGGSDFVELYNRSQKIIDASRLYIANRNSSGAAGSFRLVSAGPRYLYPGDYLVMTEDRVRLSVDFRVQNPDAVVEVTSLPSYPDDRGTVLLMDLSGKIIDEVSYSEKWQFSLLSNTEGISLERLDPAGASQDPGNWHSAASTAGFGTPGYRNSQAGYSSLADPGIQINPAVFSPDNDGRDDITQIHYQVKEPGWVANIIIFDSGGYLVRRLVGNQIMGLEGTWSWDGLGDSSNPLAPGVYVLYIELFNLRGQIQRIKKAVVLAKSFR